MITTLSITCLNEQGKRENIEDAIYPNLGEATPTDRLFLVCDGVGGESKGEEASRITTESLANYFVTNLFNEKLDEAKYLSDAQLYVIEQMEAFIHENPEAERMSTTLTLAYLAESKILTAWCGDSRIYHFRNGNVLWRSEDHSMVSMLVKTGEISESEAENHPQKNIILRSINANSKPSDIETHWLTDIQTGDYLLLCTDGVLEQMNDERFKSILKNENSDKRILFLNYCEGKTSDNFSLYLIKLKTDKPNIVNIKNKNNQLVVIIGILIAVILVLMLFFLLPSKNPKTSLPKRDTSINTKPQSKVQKHKESDVVIPK